MYQYQQKAKDGTIYVFQAESKWIPELKQPRQIRTCLGKIDPETGELVPTGPRGRKAKKKPEDETEQLNASELKKALAVSQRANEEMKAEITELKREVKQYRDAEKLRKAKIQKITQIMESL